jgi:hypothetical protein
MPPVGFETTISAGERPQTYALDRATTGTGPISDSEFVFATEVLKTGLKPGGKFTDLINYPERETTLSILQFLARI